MHMSRMKICHLAILLRNLSYDCVLLNPVYELVVLSTLVQRPEIWVLPAQPVRIHFDQIRCYVPNAHDEPSQSFYAVIDVGPYKFGGPVKGRKSTIIVLVP